MNEFNKKFWAEALDASAIIIDRNCYHIMAEDAKGFRGHGGRLFKIQFTDKNHPLAKFIASKGADTLATTNLWHQGEIPEELYKGDNAKFI